MMSKIEKMLLKAKANQSGLSFAEFETLLANNGWKFDRQGGSHRIWIGPNGERLSIQSKNGSAKGYQVKQFLRIQEIGCHG